MCTDKPQPRPPKSGGLIYDPSQFPSLMKISNIRSALHLSPTAMELMTHRGQVPPPTHYAEITGGTRWLFWSEVDPTFADWFAEARRMAAAGVYRSRMPANAAWADAAADPQAWVAGAAKLISITNLAKAAKLGTGRHFYDMVRSGKIPRPDFYTGSGWYYVATPALQEWASATAATAGQYRRKHQLKARDE